MRSALRRLLDDPTPISLALAIAIGLALFRVASAFAQFVTTLLAEHPEPDALLDTRRVTDPVALTWIAGDRIVILGPFVQALIELSVVVAIAALLRSRTRHNGEAHFANPS